MGFNRPDNFRWIYSARLVRIIDGDTVVLLVDRGDRDYSEWTIRMSEDGDEKHIVDCWESRTRDLVEKEKGIEATRALFELFDIKGDVVLETFGNERGSLKRMLGNMHWPDGTAWVQFMRDNGHMKRDWKAEG